MACFDLDDLVTPIADQLEAIPHTLQTIPGIGPVFSAGVIYKIGPLERFEFNQAKPDASVPTWIVPPTHGEKIPARLSRPN